MLQIGQKVQYPNLTELNNERGIFTLVSLPSETGQRNWEIIKIADAPTTTNQTTEQQHRRGVTA